MRACRVLLLAVTAAAALRHPCRAQTYEVIHVFDVTDGKEPLGKLLPVGTDLYGTTTLGGDTGSLCAAGCGTVFKIDSANTLTTLHAFDSATEGILPGAGLVLGNDGNYYGTTPGGGALGDGTVYRMDGTGFVTTIHDFDHDTGGWLPRTPLVLGDDGNLYGTTPNGHCDDDTGDCGIVFRMTTGGGLTTLHTFNTDEGFAPVGPVLKADSGDFYGTTTRGGGGNPATCGTGCGTIFRMTSSGALTTVHAFGWDDGSSPIGALVQGPEGAIYGVTNDGGASGSGTIYRIAADGGFTSLHSFDGNDGAFPLSGLILASDGNYYGTTEFGGASNFGTLFRMDPAGIVTVLHHFDGSSQNLTTGFSAATAELVQGSDGKLYGARFRGGDNGAGFLYRYSLLPPAPLFCPNAFVRRDQMAVFLLKTEHGAAHVPPDCANAFPDVACPGLFADWIEELAAEGITAGCGGGDYCPLSPITRAQMAVFLLKTEHGTGFTPPACVGTFPDVPCSDPFAAWIEALAGEGITAGCGGGNYCPANPVTRAQMAAFLLKVEHGAAYAPPACTPLFADVPCPSLFADWIEELYTEGITAGCAGGAP